VDLVIFLNKEEATGIKKKSFLLILMIFLEILENNKQGHKKVLIFLYKSTLILWRQ